MSMNYGQVKDQFINELRRGDIKPSRVEVWMNMAIQRIQQVLFIPANEALLEIPVTNLFTKIEIPGDYIKLKSLSIDGFELAQRSYSVVYAEGKFAGYPKSFCRVGGDILVGPKPSPGSTILLYYYKNFPALIQDSDENYLTNAAAELLLTGALVVAWRALNNLDRMQVYDMRFMQLLADIKTQSDMDELLNAEVTPAYDFNCPL